MLREMEMQDRSEGGSGSQGHDVPASAMVAGGRGVARRSSPRAPLDAEPLTDKRQSVRFEAQDDQDLTRYHTSLRFLGMLFASVSIVFLHLVKSGMTGTSTGPTALVRFGSTPACSLPVLQRIFRSCGTQCAFRKQHRKCYWVCVSWGLCDLCEITHVEQPAAFHFKRRIFAMACPALSGT